jgi:hypothetical protein
MAGSLREGFLRISRGGLLGEIPRRRLLGNYSLGRIPWGGFLGEDFLGSISLKRIP